MEPALSKRIVGIRIDARIGREEGLANFRLMKESQQTASVAFFSEYVRIMLPKVRKMVEDIKEGVSMDSVDIFVASSSTIIKIWRRCGETTPKYVRKLTVMDYLGDKVASDGALKKIRDAWENEPQRFSIRRGENALVYSYPENGRTHELKYLADELPAKLEVKLFSSSISMNLKEAEKLFGIRFRKGILERVKEMSRR